MPQNAAKEAAPPPGGKRVTDYEFFRRLEYVDGLLRDGRARADIVAACEHKYAMSARTCDEYCARSRVRWQQQAELATVDVRTSTLQRIEVLLSRLERERAWAPLVSMLRLQVDVLGLTAPHRMIVETPKADQLARIGLCEIVREMTAAMRGTVRAIHFGIATPSNPDEKATYMDALRELSRAADDALRVIRTGKLHATVA